MHIRIALACAAAPLLAATLPAHAAPNCTADALNALKVTDVTIADAKMVAATAQVPAHCDMQGTVVTRGEGAPDGLARFSLQLPDGWRQRFLFLGVGGNAGNLQPSANSVDRASALGKGYAMVLTDTGHAGDGTTAKWARKPDGSVDTAKVTDFFYRAAHDVGMAAKAFTQAYYAAPIQHAYFDGCSTGGRMALVEAEHYPGDYSGVIAGDPAMDFKLNLARAMVQKAALRGSQTYIPEDLLTAIDARVTERCDEIDGAKDGLIQNPALCPVRAEDLLCRPGESKACLNADQAAFLHSYSSPMRDRAGHIVYPGWPITNMSGVAVSDYTTGKTPPNLAQPATPWADNKVAPRGWQMAHEALAYYLGDGPAVDMNAIDIDPATNVIGDSVLANVADFFTPGEGNDPAKLQPFIAGGGKLILYHGASDQSIPPERTITFYQQLTAMQHGQDKTEASVRLFLVPGMHHCAGGVGPDRFDTLSALENWVEHGQAPAAIMASTRPESTTPHHLPLCPYPQQARYGGTGDVADAKNWSCRAPRP